MAVLWWAYYCNLMFSRLSSINWCTYKRSPSWAWWWHCNLRHCWMYRHCAIEIGVVQGQLGGCCACMLTPPVTGSQRPTPSFFVCGIKWIVGGDVMRPVSVPGVSFCTIVRPWVEDFVEAFLAFLVKNNDKLYVKKAVRRLQVQTWVTRWLFPRLHGTTPLVWSINPDMSNVRHAACKQNSWTLGGTRHILVLCCSFTPVLRGYTYLYPYTCRKQARTDRGRTFSIKGKQQSTTTGAKHQEWL